MSPPELMSWMVSLMRTINFRGKTLEPSGLRQAGEWATGGYFVDTCYGGCPEGKHHIVEFNTTGLGYFAHTRVEAETVGQYIGLEDKNGKRIFEGDILEYPKRSFHDNGNEKGFVYYNKWAEWSINGWLVNKLNHLAEVIGNIHDNPELLVMKDGEFNE